MSENQFCCPIMEKMLSGSEALIKLDGSIIKDNGEYKNGFNGNFEKTKLINGQIWMEVKELGILDGYPFNYCPWCGKSLS